MKQTSWAIWRISSSACSFGTANYERLARRIALLKGKAIVSLNDHPDIRECFKGFEMESLEIDYTVGGGANKATRRELIIYSWPISAEPAGLF